jgi:hypothetical protein
MRKEVVVVRFIVRLLLVSLLFMPLGLLAQSAKPAEPTLLETVQGLDAALFDAYNHCDIAKLSSLVDDNLEFYHDKDGLSIGKAVFLESYKKNICNKVQRMLVPASLEVYPLNGYGAVEMGTHRFQQPANPAEGIGEARFVMLWQHKDNTWKLTRVISYDHGALAR